MKNNPLLILLVITIYSMMSSACGHFGRDYEVDREQYPIKGIDLSAHNGIVDFEKVKSDSVDFVYLKATEGADFCDPMFERNATNAQRAGIPVGAYHFFRFETPGHLQAYNFLTAASKKRIDLPLAIDVENWENAEDIPEAEIINQLTEMINVLQEAGYSVVIYTNKQGYDQYIGGNFTDNQLWLSSLGAVPDAHWTLWQHSHRGQIDGANGDVDMNTYNGDRAEFERWISLSQNDSIQ